MSRKPCFQRDIDLTAPVRLSVMDGLPWRSVLRQASERPRPIAILTYNLPSVAWFAEQFPRLSMRQVAIIANSEFREKAQALKRAYDGLRIVTHPKLHSKAAAVFPDRLFVSSANLGSMGQHETLVELSSKLAYDWWIEAAFEPLWAESEAVSTEQSRERHDAE